MSDPTLNPSDDEPSGNRLTRLKQQTDWNAYGKIGAGAVLGLLLNGVAIAMVATGDPMGIVRGVISLSPALILAGALFHRYNPVDLSFVGPALLFVTIAVANMLSVTVAVFRMGPQSNPMMSVLILAVVALMFTPGPFLGVYAARRWWL